MSLALQRRAGPRLWLHLIGPMQALDAHGSSLLPRTRKTRAVLAILAMASPRPVPRARITALLWSRREREQARGSLRQCIHELQGLLQPLGPGVIEADREQLRLADDAVWLDLRVTGPSPPPGRLLEDLDGLDPAFDAWREARAGASRPRRSARAEPARGAARRRPLRVLGPEDDTALADGLGHEIAAALSRVPLDRLPLALGALADRRGGGRVSAGRHGEPRRHAAPGGAASPGDADRRRGRLGTQFRPRRHRPAAAAGRDRGGDRGAGGAGTAAAGRCRAATRLARGASPDDLTLAAIPGILRLERDGFERAGRLLGDAVRLAPEHVAAHAWFAYWHILAVGQGWELEAGAALARAGMLAERAVTLDPSDARALTIAGHVRSFLDRQVDEALALHERALALNPALPLAWMMSGLAYCYLGEHREAIRRIETARRLSPFDPHAFFFDGALMVPHLLLGEFERACRARPADRAAQAGLLVELEGAAVRAGPSRPRHRGAEVRARLLALEPGFTVADAIRRSPLRRPEDRAVFAEGLRLGGLR